MFSIIMNFIKKIFSINDRFDMFMKGKYTPSREEIYTISKRIHSNKEKIIEIMKKHICFLMETLPSDDPNFNTGFITALYNIDDILDNIKDSQTSVTIDFNTYKIKSGCKKSNGLIEQETTTCLKTLHRFLMNEIKVTDLSHSQLSLIIAINSKLLSYYNNEKVKTHPDLRKMENKGFYSIPEETFTNRVSDIVFDTVAKYDKVNRIVNIGELSSELSRKIISKMNDSLHYDLTYRG